MQLKIHLLLIILNGTPRLFFIFYGWAVRLKREKYLSSQ